MKFYVCEHCGNIITFVKSAGVPVMCCGQKMTEIVPGTTDAAVEKHVPVISKVDGGYKVVVGSVAHPMLENHYIQWIELVAGNESLTHFLKPGDAPEAVFKTDAEKVVARAYCNLHGHWKAEN